jgi:hypothetical protein
VDQYQIMSLLTRLAINHTDPYIVSLLYADTLTSISDCITLDKMRRLLIVGAHIHNTLDKTANDDTAESTCGNNSLPKTLQ